MGFGTTAPTRAVGWVLLLTAGGVACYASTWWSMAEIWLRSDTFRHGFLVVPAFVGLVWSRRFQLANLPVTPSATGLLALVLLGGLWLVAEAASAAVVAQAAAVAVVPALILAAFGGRWLAALAFPCVFLFFAVPFGEAFVPTLIDWTADFTVAALRLTHVPVYREGTQFVIPSGRWSVVEACSGIRYLIAASMAGTLYAWLTYRSPWRRGLFVAVSFVVPIVANWLRAYGIVMLGHLTNNALATGADHLIYGWLFFALVLLAMFAIGSRWREDDAAAPRTAAVPGRADLAPAVRLSLTGKAILGCAVALTVLWPVLRPALIARSGVAPLQASTRLELPGESGWTRVEAFSPWRASAPGAVLGEVGFFGDHDHRVGVQIYVFRDQGPGAQLVSSANQFTPPGDAAGWFVLSKEHRRMDGPAPSIEYRKTLLGGNSSLQVRDWYWTGTRVTTSNLRAKLDLAVDRLLNRDDTSAWVIVFASAEQGRAEDEAALDRFMRDMTPGIERALRRLRP